ECVVKPSSGAIACMVNAEIGSVLAVMRRNVRWSVLYGADGELLEHSLVSSFKELRKKIFSWQNLWNSVDPISYINPFLDVIKSDETDATVTGAALSSVYKILSMQILDSKTVNVESALRLIVDVVTTCRFEVTDPASEEAVLMKILQVLSGCMKNQFSNTLSNHHVCSIVNTCFRIVHQASSRSELLQKASCHSMHELINSIFLRLPHLDYGSSFRNMEADAVQIRAVVEKVQISGFSFSLPATIKAKAEEDDVFYGPDDSMMDPFGLPAMVEIFHFLCSLPDVMMEEGNIGINGEDVPLFALGLINSIIELVGPSLGYHPKLLSLIQDKLFFNLMRFGFSTSSPLVLSAVCSIALNLYYHLRTKLKLQLEAFISGVLFRVAEGNYGSSYRLQEVAMEALVDFCRQPTFVSELYANYDCDLSCNDLFEGIADLLSRNAVPVSSQLSSVNILALDGLIVLLHSMVDRIGLDTSDVGKSLQEIPEAKPFWTLRCHDYDELVHWVPFVHAMKMTKKKLMIGVDHFNRDPQEGLEFLQELHLLPEKLDPGSVARFFRYAVGLDKNLVGEFLSRRDEFSTQVLRDFAKSFDFHDMNLETALRTFLETFRLPGESQKILRVLEAFSESFYEQCSKIFVSKDVAFLLSYSLVMLNTDQHSLQVKNRMTEEDFIANHRRINGGNDLPRDYLSEIYHSIRRNEISTLPDRVEPAATTLPSRSDWIGLLQRAKRASPYIVSDAESLLDPAIFSVLSRPVISAVSAVFDRAAREEVLNSCIDGFLAMAELSVSYDNGEVINDLVLSLCKFAPTDVDSIETKVKMAIEAIFAVSNRYGDYVRSGWKNVVECISNLHKIGVLSSDDIVADAIDDSVRNRSSSVINWPSIRVVPARSSRNIPRKRSGIMGRFTLLLSRDSGERSTDERIAEKLEHVLRTVQNCNIDRIFAESKFLRPVSLSELANALLVEARLSFTEDESQTVFRLDLLIAVALVNCDRIMLVWPDIYGYVSDVVQSVLVPCDLVEKAIFGLLRVCKDVLPYQEDLTDELLIKSLQLVLKLDPRVSDAYCERIASRVMDLMKANASRIRSHVTWRSIVSLLSITVRHPEASETGFEILSFIMSGGSGAPLLSPANYVICINAGRLFVESSVSPVERCIKSLNLMSDSIFCLSTWFRRSKEEEEEASEEMWLEMWVRLLQGLRIVSTDYREEVRNHAIVSLQKCLSGGIDGIRTPSDLWVQFLNQLIFTLLDELIEIGQRSRKQYGSVEVSMVLALELVFEAFAEWVVSRGDLSQAFDEAWVKLLRLMERCLKMRFFRGKRSEKIHGVIHERLKKTLSVMKTLVNGGDFDGFWLDVKDIVPSLESE
ncbi:hypothetical protein M569_02992, partial [Genlisea aurea]